MQVMTGENGEITLSGRITPFEDVVYCLCMNIQVDLNEAYLYMGGKGKPEKEDLRMLKEASSLILDTVSLRTIDRFSETEKTDKGISLKGTSIVLSGKAAGNLLKDCSSCMVFCVTIGQEAETLIRKWEVKDIAFAAALDVCASAAVESLCELEEKSIAQKYAKGRGKNGADLFLTDRFSPGYEDMPLSLQKDLCGFLDTGRKIGVLLSESALMIPRKSVTAILGLSEKEQKHRDTGCAFCPSFPSCNFRKNGVTCYGHIL